MTRSAVSIVALFVVASLALVDRRAECGCLTGSKNKLSKEWQWIDNFLNDGASNERINKYFAENQAEMEPKLRAAFKLLVDAANVNSAVNGCSETESLKIGRLFSAINLDMNAELDEKATGVRQFALERRQDYGVFCAERYNGKIIKVLLRSLDRQTISKVEGFSIVYDVAREFRRMDLFDPSEEKKFGSAIYVTSTLLGKSLYSGLKDVLPGRKKMLNKKTGKEEYNWVELVKEMREGCNSYKHQVETFLEEPSADAVISRALQRLNLGHSIWRAWITVIACDQLDRFDNGELAEKMAAAAAKSQKIKDRKV